MKTAGQHAYEADCAMRPLYPDGAARPGWEKLSNVVRGSWEKNPTPRWTRVSYPASEPVPR